MTFIPKKQYRMIAGKIEKKIKENKGTFWSNWKNFVKDLQISPKVVLPEIAPWKITWPDVEWFVLEKKKNNRVGENYCEFIQTVLKTYDKGRDLGWQFQGKKYKLVKEHLID